MRSSIRHLRCGRIGKDRAEIITKGKGNPLSSQGRTLKDISGKTGLSWQNCLKWRSRFQEEGIEGLKDKGRSGRPPIIDPKKKKFGDCIGVF